VSTLERIHATRQLLTCVEEAKHDLTTALETDLTIPSFLQGRSLDEPLTRSTFNGLLEPHLERIRTAVDTCLLRSDLRTRDIDRVLLVGGASNVPVVRELVRDIFAKEPVAPKNPQQAVVEGAALYAGMLARATTEMPTIYFDDVVSYPIGLEMANGTMDILIGRDVQLPATSNTRIYSVRNPERPSIAISVLQGNSNRAARNTLIGRIVEPAVTRGPDGQARVEVQLSVNEENVVSYRLRDLQSDQVRTGLLLTEGVGDGTHA
jgi:molecular chaperone DnaK